MTLKIAFKCLCIVAVISIGLCFFLGHNWQMSGNPWQQKVAKRKVLNFLYMQSSLQGNFEKKVFIQLSRETAKLPLILKFNSIKHGGDIKFSSLLRIKRLDKKPEAAPGSIWQIHFSCTFLATLGFFRIKKCQGCHIRVFPTSPHLSRECDL